MAMRSVLDPRGSTGGGPGMSFLVVLDLERHGKLCKKGQNGHLEGSKVKIRPLGSEKVRFWVKKVIFKVLEGQKGHF
jgi:hypothetical protein